MQIQRGTVNRFAFVLLAASIAALSCSTSKNKGTGGSSPAPTPAPSPGNTEQDKGSTTGKNLMDVTVNGALCGDSGSASINQPCVKVTICEPGTSNCQTISNLLLDTGSSGLRVFSSIVTLNLQPATVAGGALTECISYADNASEWGPVVYADIVLGSEPPVKSLMHLIQYDYATPPPACTAAQSTPDKSPSQIGFNGILGVGLFNQDCGKGCANDPNNGQYFSCSGGTCSNVSTSLQVQNPVALLPSDNNGIILKLPAVPDLGTASASGTLVLGIGTQGNNTPPTTIKVYPTDSAGYFTTTFAAYGSTAMPSFIDSGSNFLSLPQIASLPLCVTLSGTSSLFCPSSIQPLSAVNNGSSGGVSAPVSFQIGNAIDLTADKTLKVFNDIAASSGSPASFDWGLPFFLGRDVYVGLEGRSSTLATGTYWAY